jgi:hypothetical protein
MKKLLIICTIALLSFTVIEKELTVKAPIEVWDKHFKKLEIIRQIADESNLPNQQVKFITRSIDSLEMLVVPQIRLQLADTTKQK